MQMPPDNAGYFHAAYALAAFVYLVGRIGAPGEAAPPAWRPPGAPPQTPAEAAPPAAMPAPAPVANPPPAPAVAPAPPRIGA